MQVITNAQPTNLQKITSKQWKQTAGNHCCSADHTAEKSQQNSGNNLQVITAAQTTTLQKRHP
jgi:hypothetical protein